MYTCDFDGACAYFSREVSRLHGAAQLEATCNHTRKRGIYAFDAGGCGRSCFGGRYGGRGGRLVEVEVAPVVVETKIKIKTLRLSMVSTFRTPTAVSAPRNGINLDSFWNSTGGRGRENPGRHVSFIKTDDNQNNTSQNAQQQCNDDISNRNGDRGGRNGRGFGRGAHGGCQ